MSDDPVTGGPAPKRRALTGAAVLFLVSTCAPGKEGETVADGPPPNLVLISIDSLRADHLGCYGYERDTSPFLDELAAGGLRFDAALSTTSWTLPSHAAMFTGLVDSTHGLVDNGLRLGGGHRTLAQILSEAGYETVGFYGGPYLHPTFGLDRGFERYTSCMTSVDAASAGEDGADIRAEASAGEARAHRDVTGPRTRDEVLAWARDRGGDETRPFFLFVHLWDVHYDFLPPAEYVELFDPDYDGTIDGRLMTNPAIRQGMDARDLAHVIALYDAEIRFTDDIVREIFDGLRDAGLLGNTAVFVTADHGEEFFEHGRKGHNKTLFEEVVRVPLIVSWPGSIPGGRASDALVQLVDLMPTFASLAGSRTPLAVQGRDLTPELVGSGGARSEARDREVLLELLIDGRSLRALRGPRSKVVRPAWGEAAVLFDLGADPRELRPLVPVTGAGAGAGEAERDAAEARLDAAVERAVEFRERLSADEEAETIDLTEELARELRALGYLGDEPSDESP